MDERAQRIVSTAMALAAKDGFAAMKLRDVAAHAQVALGTVYRRFRSKEENIQHMAKQYIYERIQNINALNTNVKHTQ